MQNMMFSTIRVFFNMPCSCAVSILYASCKFGNTCNSVVTAPFKLVQKKRQRYEYEHRMQMLYCKDIIGHLNDIAEKPNHIEHNEWILNIP